MPVALGEYYGDTVRVKCNKEGDNTPVETIVFGIQFLEPLVLIFLCYSSRVVEDFCATDSSNHMMSR